MKLLTLTAIACGLLVLASAKPAARSYTMDELARIVEEFRVKFDDLHEEKDAFVNLARIITRAELKLLNEATVDNLADAWSDIEHHFDGTRKIIGDMIILPNANEECLLGLVEEIVAERIRAADEMSRCASDKIGIKEGLADEFRSLVNLLQRISTAAAEYTLYSFANHNSFVDPEEQIEWLERNYQNQVYFWDNVARPEAQEDLDYLEVNRPYLVEENRLCLERIQVQMTEVDRSINQRINQCVV
ncbi:AAEL011935-PA [Aedes aegypti]|uniref:AAEL011935-PA n=2 Tax=Aedes aegypti TaxID=7159 RepID=A0A1S4FV42_AEDAE|nr:uncharacterized protein LOC5575599 [Aedes aegypti]EAT35944.1 AAEL011935-PA [Aedes aegypti]